MMMDSKINIEMLKITQRKNNFQKHSISYKIIMGVFYGSFNSTDDFPAEEKRRYQQALSSLKMARLLELNDKNILLTSKGYWNALYLKLGVSYPSLWIIADMYVLEKFSRKNNTTGKYHSGIMYKRFEELVAPRCFEKPFSLLLKQDLIYRISPKFYKIQPETFEELKKYDKHLVKLQNHTCQLANQCLEKLADIKL